MKIFAVSDIHGNWEALRKIINFLNTRNDIEIVMFCGDLVGEHEYSTVKELSEIQREDYLCFKNMIKDITNKKVYYILGNHDVFKVESNDEYYLNNACSQGLENNYIPFEIVKIHFYGTSREGTEEDINTALKRINNIDKSKIIIAHQPPYGCLDKSNDGHSYGSSSIRKMIYSKKPCIYLCGHVHEAYGIQKLDHTLVVNCACDINETRGWIIDTSSLKYEKVLL